MKLRPVVSATTAPRIPATTLAQGVLADVEISDAVLPAPTRRRPITLVIRLAITVGLVILLVRSIDVTAAVGVARNAAPWFLLAALGVSLVDRIVMVVKWYPLLHVHVPGVGFWRALRVTLAANATAIALPTTVGADVVRAVALGRQTGRTAEIGASILVERLLGLVSGILYALVGVLIAVQYGVAAISLIPLMLGVAAAALIALGLPFTPLGERLLRAVESRLHAKWLGLARRFTTAYSAYRAHGTMVVNVGVLTVMEQFLPVVVYWLLALAVGLDLGIIALLGVVPITMFIARMPISIAGIGVTEGTAVYLLRLFGVPLTEALAMALLARCVSLTALLPGAIFVSDLALRRKPVDGAPLTP